MYSGTTIGKYSGNTLGAHQRLDRIARRILTPLLQGVPFPSITTILQFEGNNGPDAVKRKSPSVDEPWHYIDPKNMIDDSLLVMIDDHIANLSIALQKKDEQRAAFEASWLAHAVVDGLTPAHHFPLAEKIEELFGMPHHQRKTIKEKNLIKGVSRRDSFSKNWEYWGASGIFSAHTLFEFGVATTLLSRRYQITITTADIDKLEREGYRSYFQALLLEVDSYSMYDEFRRHGWNGTTARLVQKELIPRIIKAITLAWYAGAKGPTT